jgi:mRNA interferase MazF
VKRGELWWADAGNPVGSEPGYRRPVVIISADRFNDTAIQTIIVAFLTTTPRRATDPGNVVIPAGALGLRRDSIVNVTQRATMDRRRFMERVGRVPPQLMDKINHGLRLVLGL